MVAELGLEGEGIAGAGRELATGFPSLPQVLLSEEELRLGQM